jgi:hypothetical protein
MHQTYISYRSLFVYSVYLKKIPFPIHHYSFLPLPTLFEFFPKYWKTLFLFLFFVKQVTMWQHFPPFKFRVIRSKIEGRWNSVFIKWGEKYSHWTQEEEQTVRKGFFLLTISGIHYAFNSIHLSQFFTEILSFHIFTLNLTLAERKKKLCRRVERHPLLLKSHSFTLLPVKLFSSHEKIPFLLQKGKNHDSSDKTASKLKITLTKNRERKVF